MTEPLYQKDAYLKTFDATVVEVKEGAVALDRTAFYPTGGGQPHDLGTLADNGTSFEVTGVKREGELIWHSIEGDLPPVGTEVHGEIDWDRRYSLMRTHTAMHILCGVIWRDYAAKVTGGNMEPLQGRMDFEFEGMHQELVREIENSINEEVERGRPITVEFLERDAADKDPDLIRTKVNLLPKDIKEVRVVEIQGLDRQADGGTHVATTDQVGRISIVEYKSKGKANKRLKIALSDI